MTDNIYMNIARKSWKYNERYIRHHKYDTYGYIKELFGTRCLLDIALNGNKVEVLANISDISIIDESKIPEEIFQVIKIESEWEWMDNYFKDIID